jgi:hypothetical protein
MIDTSVRLVNVRAAADPMFFADADPKKHRCLIPVIKNLGKHPTTGQPMTQSYTVIFWAKYAELAALMIEKGRQITLDGVLRTFNKELGNGPDGKKQYSKITTIHARRFELGADSTKALIARINDNIAKGKASGLIPPQMTVGGDFLLAVVRPKHRPFNPAEVASTGKFGFAKVSLGKGQGWVGAGAAVVAGAVTAPVMTKEQIAAQIASLQAQMNAAATAATGAGAVDPFAVGA